MHKVDAPGATPEGEFQDGNPGQGVEATLLAAKWHNTIQNELVNLVEESGQTLDDQNDEQVVEAVRRVSSNRVNHIINGDFSIANRGAVPGTSGTVLGTHTVAFLTLFGCDRWRVSRLDATPGFHQFSLVAATAADAATIKVGQFARIERPDVPNTSALGFLTTYLEDVRKYANRTMTLRFFARSTPNTKVGIRIAQATQVKSPAFEISVVNTNIAVGTDWTPITVTVDLPSLGAAALTPQDHALKVQLVVNGGNDQTWTTFDVAAVQLVDGNFAGDFPRRPIAEEAALCARYYQSSIPRETVFNAGKCIAVGTGIAQVFGLQRSLAPMRRTPTVRWNAATVPTNLSAPQSLLVDGVSQEVATDGAAYCSTGWPAVIAGTVGSGLIVEGYYAAFGDFIEA